MITGTIIAGVFVIGSLILYACCCAASDADRRAERMWEEYNERKNKANNSKINNGE